MLYQSQTLESSILYLFPWAFGGLGEYGAFGLLSDRASKNNEVPQLFSLPVVLFCFVLFLVRARGFQGQVTEMGCVSRWPQGSLLGKGWRSFPSQVLLPAPPQGSVLWEIAGETGPA